MLSVGQVTPVHLAHSGPSQWFYVVRMSHTAACCTLVSSVYKPSVCVCVCACVCVLSACVCGKVCDSHTTSSPENFLRGALLHLLVRDYPGFKILLGLGVVDGGDGVGLAGSLELPVLPQGHIPRVLTVQVTRLLRPVHAQQAQREP